MTPGMPRGAQKFCQNRSCLNCFQDKCDFVYYAEIHDGRQKWPENNFWEKSPDDSAHTLEVKYFTEITLAHKVSKINVLHFTQKFKMTTKNGGKTIFGKRVLCRYPSHQKFHRNCSVSHCF